MDNLSSLPDDELTVLAQSDDPAALFEKGRRVNASGEAAEARKFFTFASVLGNRDAHKALAAVYEGERRLDDARDLYALAYLKGDEAALPKYARLLTRSDEKTGLNLLKYYAVEGNTGCIAELVAYYKETGEQKEVKFWSNWLERLRRSSGQ
ncbi:MAG: hypothetical protein FWD58_10695 [Firmicutes bacterium]|nr:hypothetical protein [Bacillota bacterium]